jgi:hypothetical protein
MRNVAALVVFSLVVVSCGTQGDETTSDVSAVVTSAAPPDTTAPSAPGTTTADPATTTSSEVADGSPNPLVIAGVDFGNGQILIRNVGSQVYDLTGHWLCNRPNYAPLPEVPLNPGETIEIAASLIGVAASNGEVALYTSQSFTDPNSIVRYVQWGADSHGRTSVAVAGGVWQDGDFVDNAGKDLESAGSDPVSAADWASE